MFGIISLGTSPSIMISVMDSLYPAPSNRSLDVSNVGVDDGDDEDDEYDAGLPYQPNTQGDLWPQTPSGPPPHTPNVRLQLSL